MELHDLPKSWVWTTLGEICNDPQYGWTTSASQSGDLRLLRTTDITSGNIDWNTVPYCSENPSAIDKYLLRDGDIVISRAGSVGYSYLLSNPERAVFASYLIRFKPIGVNGRYIAYFLQSPSYWQSISDNSSGIAIPNVNASKLKTIEIPVAPLPEQERIVEAIEAQLSRIEAGVASVRNAQRALRRYKASVLNAACTGQLLPQDSTDEPAALLLERILAERRQQWETEQREKYAAQGKPLPKGWQDKYPAPAAPDTTSLPDLPQGWVWANLDTLGEVRNGVTKGKRYADKQTIQVPYLRVANVQDNYLDLSNIKDIEIGFDELEKYRLQDNDILFNEGGDRDKLGRGYIWKSQIQDCVHQNHVYSVRLYSVSVLPTWINYVRQVNYAKDYFWKFASQTVNLASINATNLRGLPIPLPSLAEQYRVVEEMERRLSVVAALEQTVTATLQRAARLRQSVLRKAFRGELVASRDIVISTSNIYP